MPLYNHKGKIIENESGFRDLEYAIHRGDLLSNFFKRFLTNSKNKTIADLGCGKGGLSMAFSKDFQKVESIDINSKNIETTKTRAKRRNITNLTAQQGNALNLPFKDNSLNAINNTGLIEWLGNNQKETPYQCQKQFIKEIHRILKPGSIAITATENRFFPYFWIREPHNHTFLLGLLPFHLANLLSKIFRRKNYCHRLLYHRELSKIFRPFQKNEVYVGIPNYQYPYELVSINNHQEIKQAANRVLQNKKLPPKLQLQVHWMKIISSLKLTKLLTTNLFIVSHK